MPIYALSGHEPNLPPPGTYWVAPDAHVIGKVTLSADVGIWFGAVLRGDNEPIVIGDDSNIQELSVLHTDPGAPLTIGRNVTVGHQVMLHGCTIGDGSLIGIQSIVLNRSVIGKDCLVGAGSVVTEGKSFPDRSMILGSPAKVVRELSEENAARLAMSAESYVKRGQNYKANLKRIG